MTRKEFKRHACYDVKAAVQFVIETERKLLRQDQKVLDLDEKLQENHK